MINLDEYIKEMTTHKNYDGQYDYLDNIILDHCYIHYAFNYRLITEGYIYENDGTFPEQHKLVKFIKNEIDNEKKQTYILDLNYSFINKLHIYLRENSKSDINGGYIYDNEKYDDYNEIRWYKDNEKFRFAEIIIYNYDKNPDGLEEMLYHETKHLWDDYIEISKKNSFLSDKIKKSLDYKLKKENIEDILKNIIYYSEDYEISAYISQINSILKNGYIDIKEAFNDIYDSYIYQNYKFIYYILLNDTYKDEILKHISIKEYNKIKKNIKYAWKKIIKVTYEVCCNHLTDYRMTPNILNHKIKGDI